MKVKVTKFKIVAIIYAIFGAFTAHHMSYLVKEKDKATRASVLSVFGIFWPVTVWKFFVEVINIVGKESKSSRYTTYNRPVDRSTPRPTYSRHGVPYDPAEN